MNIAGIDIGSTYIKFAMKNDDDSFILRKMPTTFEPLKQCLSLLEEFKPERTIATGYGRNLLEVYADIETITEIKAFAIGAKRFFPNCKTVIDIGGQDTKVISLTDEGKIRKFEMNDRCAAGTGRFLEIMAKTLGYSLEEFGNISIHNNNTTLQLSSICTVFVESEVVSLISKGIPRQEIALAVLNSMINRVVSMIKRVGDDEDIVFAGGCAKNKAMKELLETKLGKRLLVSENSEFFGAFGAVFYAVDK